MKATDPKSPLYDPTDKYLEYKVDFEANEKHEENEWDNDHEGKISDWHNRHQDKLLDDFCNDHPGAPQCKVFDE